MPEPSGSTLNRLKRWWAGGEGAAPPLAGERFVGTGLEAVLAVARAAGSHLVAGRALGGRAALAGVASGGAAAAFGLALGGVRTTLLLRDDELEAAAPSIAEAVSRSVPLVVVVVGNRGWREAALAGAALLVPADVQEAIDLAIAARLFAEDALATVVIALEDAALAEATQSALLPAAARLRERFGSGADSVHPATVAQRALFGAHRRRVPRWHDAGARRRLGGEPGPLAAAAMDAGTELFLVRDRARRLDEACSAVAAATGRELDAVAGRSLSRSVLGLIATGPWALLATATAESMRRDGPRVNVLRLRCLSPLPGDLLAGLTDSGRGLALLDRVASPGGEGPLADLAPAALARAGGHQIAATLVIAGRDPRIGGGELAAALRRVESGAHGRLTIGLPSEAELRDLYPKRAARRDELAREEPRLSELEGESPAAIETRPAGAITLRLDRLPAEPSLVPLLSRLLDDLVGGHLRARIEARPASAGRRLGDRLSWSPHPFVDPGESGACEIVLASSGAGLEEVAAGTVLLAASPAVLPEAFKRRVERGEVEALEIPRPAEGEPAELAVERTLGALVAAMARRGVVEVAERRLRGAREKRLGQLDESDRQRRLDALLAGFSGLTAIAVEAIPAPAVETLPPLPFAASARAGHRHDELGDAARFWDVAGLPLRERADALAAVDPDVALQSLPACSASRDADGDLLPALDPTLCTGCGLCWSLCPHAAIEARSIGAAALLDSAMVRAAAAGRNVEPLRRFLPKLATEWERRAAAARGAAAGALLGEAGGTVLDGARLDGERRQAADAALAALADELGEMAAIAAAPFTAGGEVLALALDPGRCTGCGICVASCEPAAWSGETRRPAKADAWRRRAVAVRALPAPSRERVEALAGAPEPGRLAAVLLDPDAARTLEGFDAAPAGDAARLAVRQALAMASFELAPRRSTIRARARELGERLAEAVRTALARALPGSDLEALAQGLDRLDAPAAGLPELAGRLAGAVEAEQVDVVRLRRLVEAARAVADLESSLGGDRENPPRAPLSVVVGGGEALAWARRYPDNPFGLPALVAEREPLGVARGLAAAEAERALAEARVLRQARLELERPAEAVAGGVRPELGWSDLNDEERSLATPVVALVDERAAEAFGDDVLAALGGELPLVVLTLAPLPGRRPSPWAALAFAAPAGIVAHATPAHADALAAAVTAAVRGGGALVRLLAPTAERGAAAFENLEKIRRAVEARVFPLSCRDAAAHTTAAALRVDPLAEAGEREAHHAAELAAMEERHRAELERLETETRRRLAERARQRLLEIAASRRRREVS